MAPIGAKRRDKHSPEEKQRLQAAGKMQVAYRRLKRVRRGLTHNLWWAKLFAVISSLAILFVLDFSLGIIALVIGANALNLYLSVLAIRFVDRRPFIWAMWILLLHLTEVAGQVYEGGPWFVSACWAVWFVVIATDAWKLESEAKDYPDLFLSKRLRNEHLTHDPETSGSIRKRHRAVERSRAFSLWRRRFIWVGATAALSYGAVAGYRVYTAPPSPESMLEEFRAAWNADDVAAVAAEGYTERMCRQLERNLPSLKQRNEWGLRLPQLEEPSWTETEAFIGTLRARANFPGQTGSLSLRLEYLNHRWVVTSLKWNRDEARALESLR